MGKRFQNDACAHGIVGFNQETMVQAVYTQAGSQIVYTCVYIPLSSVWWGQMERKKKRPTTFLKQS